MNKMAVKAESKKHADLLNLHQRATTRRLIKPRYCYFPALLSESKLKKHRLQKLQSMKIYLCTERFVFMKRAVGF